MTRLLPLVPALWLLCVPVSGAQDAGASTTATAPATTVSAGAPPAGRREATVDFVWYSGQPGTDQAHGGTSPATIRIDRNTAPGASVGVIEEFAGGAGGQWRSTAWIAAVTAAHAASSPFLQTEFTVRTGGHVDGPSAGMLTTATFLALLRGDAVLPDVTMTGTINPDGTAGPVGGIPQKIQGAAAAGKRRFGYPIGSRQSEDLRTGKMVDLEAVAGTLGVQAVEVRTLRDAYRLLTGVDLGAPTLADEADLRVSPELMQAARVRVDVWRASAEAGYGRVQPILAGLDAPTREALAWVYAPIFAEVRAAQSYEKGGQLIAAESKWIEATINVAAAEDELAILGHAGRGQLDSAFGVLTPYLELEQQAGRLLEEVAANFSSVNNAVGAVNAVLAADAIVDSLALLETGKAGLRVAVATAKRLEASTTQEQAQATQQQFVLLLVKTAPVLARAEAMLAAARMEIAFAGDTEAGGAPVRDDKLADTARAYASAASAGRAYFQSLVGLDDDNSPAFAFREPGWATASAGALIAASFAGRPSPAEQLFAVASGGHAYLSAATLQNKYYALDFRDGAIGKRAALTAQMTAAREAALAAVARVKAASGRVPVRLVTSFQHAEELREGSDLDKLTALASYWHTSFAAELAAELTAR